MAGHNTRSRAFINDWNDRYRSFVGTKTNAAILEKANHPTTSETTHQFHREIGLQHSYG